MCPARTPCGWASLFSKMIQCLFTISVSCTLPKCLSEQLLVWVHCTHRCPLWWKYKGPGRCHRKQKYAVLYNGFYLVEMETEVFSLFWSFLSFFFSKLRASTLQSYKILRNGLIFSILFWFLLSHRTTKLYWLDTWIWASVYQQREPLHFLALSSI